MLIANLLSAMALVAAPNNEAKMPAALEVASVQMAVTGDMPANLARMLRGIDDAAAAGARVVVFPETALSGFSRDTIAALDWVALGEAMVQVADRAKARGVYVVYGTATPSPFEKPYNSAVIVGPDGEEVFRYHKSLPEPWFEAGDRLALFDIDGVPCTVIVCHDSRFPELVRLPVLAGARICFYISYEINSVEGARRKKEGYRAQSIARAVENGVWYVQANGIGPEDGDSLSLGNSVIVDPGGVVVAQAPELEDHMMCATLWPAAARRGNALEGLECKHLGEWWESGLEQLDAWRAGAAAGTRQAPDGRFSLRLALMQSVPVKWDLKANFETFLRLLDDAKGADIFITPECWLDGYAAPDKASTPDKLREVAQPLDTSPYLERVAEEARKRNMYICFGFSSVEDGQIFNAAGLWDNQGQRLGVYHKTHLQTHDLQYSPGMDLPVWPTPWGNVGTMICADRRWPETARTLRLKGAKLILNPTYGMHHLANEWWMRTRAYENQCYIAFAHPEVGFVTTPRGGLAAKRADAPGVLLCDVNLTRAKDDNHIRDRRPDLYGVIAAPK